MTKKTTIIRLPIEKLFSHPENPNLMSKVNFQKLKNHIGESGQYEPLIVRKHPQIKGSYQIINGHHRFKALKEIGEKNVDCVQWEATDDQVRILLATLNRLGGKDQLSFKTDLIKKLSQNFSTNQLLKLLPDKKETIERLKEITKPLENFLAEQKSFLNSFVLFLTNEQSKIINDALAKASPREGSKSFKMAAALTKIAQDWLNINN
jgi:hypothetical protein